MLKSIIFDLDDTLLDTQNQITWHLLKKVHSFLESEGYQITFDSILDFRKKHNTTKPKADFFSRLGRRISTDPDQAKLIAKKMTDYYYSFHAPFGIALPKWLMSNLSEWSSKYDLFLVTAGRTDRQFEKINELKIRHFFNHAFVADKAKNMTKTDCFLQILQSQSHPAECALSVGNRVDLELRESKLLGMKTCLVNTGEYIHLEPKDYLEIPDYTVNSLNELDRVLQDLEGREA